MVRKELPRLALVLPFATPFAIPGALLEMIARLLLMHVVAAVIVVGSPTTLARAR